MDSNHEETSSSVISKLLISRFSASPESCENDPVRTALVRRSYSRFNTIYGQDGRKSISPERLPRALLLQMLYSVCSERMLMQQLEYNLLFRWFVGVSANEPVWHPTVFTKNRDRLLQGAVAEEFFTIVVASRSCRPSFVEGPRVHLAVPGGTPGPSCKLC